MVAFAIFLTAGLCPPVSCANGSRLAKDRPRALRGLGAGRGGRLRGPLEVQAHAGPGDGGGHLLAAAEQAARGGRPRHAPALRPSAVRLHARHHLRVGRADGSLRRSARRLGPLRRARGGRRGVHADGSLVERGADCRRPRAARRRRRRGRPLRDFHLRHGGALPRRQAALPRRHHARPRPRGQQLRAREDRLVAHHRQGRPRRGAGVWMCPLRTRTRPRRERGPHRPKGKPMSVAFKAMENPRAALEAIVQRAEERYEKRRQEIFRHTDRLFSRLMIGQWAFAVLLAWVVSPYAWQGMQKTIHLHVWVAVLLGGAITSVPFYLARTRPGEVATRHAIAVGQMLWSALLIHLTGGRIETHFHVFGSLAFLAFYRDWRLLVTATLVVSGDHLFRGLMWPESVYGIVNPEWWRFLEHAWWVAFEDSVLVWGCLRGVRETHAMAEREESLENVNLTIEQEVLVKTAALKTSMERYRMLVESTNAVPWEIDAATRVVTYISPQVTRLFGIDPEQLVGRLTLGDLVHPDDGQRVADAFAQLATAPD